MLCSLPQDDLDFFIGDEAEARRQTYDVNYPIRHGQVHTARSPPLATQHERQAGSAQSVGRRPRGVARAPRLWQLFLNARRVARAERVLCCAQIDNWDHMERFWQHCVFKYMRCEPEEHCFCLVRRQP